MAAYFCSVVMMGRATAKPELRYTGTGTPVCNVTMAINRRVSDGNNGHRDEAIFIDCVFWGRTAQTAADYLEKGHSFHVQGELVQDEIIVHKGTEKERKERKTRVKVHNLQLLPQSTRQGGKHDPAPAPGTRPAADPDQPDTYAADDEIDF